MHARGDDPTERRLTFIDVDENPLGVCLKEDRVQLFVVDSRPELEAGELRRFASVLFATYAGAPLAAQLEAACQKLGGVRDQLAATAGAEELLSALDDALAAIVDARQVMTAPGAAATPDPEPAEPPEPPEPPGPPEPPMGSVLTAYGRFRTPKRPRRAGEGDGLLGWGWVRHRSRGALGEDRPSVSDAAADPTPQVGRPAAP